MRKRVHDCSDQFSARGLSRPANDEGHVQETTRLVQVAATALMCLHRFPTTFVGAVDEMR
jgi:hypothetical protein